LARTVVDKVPSAWGGQDVGRAIEETRIRHVEKKAAVVAENSRIERFATLAFDKGKETLGN
jgi:hypothetical protein